MPFSSQGQLLYHCIWLIDIIGLTFKNDPWNKQARYHWRLEPTFCLTQGQLACPFLRKVNSCSRWHVSWSHQILYRRATGRCLDSLLAHGWHCCLLLKMNCLMMMLGLRCCLLCRDVCAACFWADVCGLTFGSVGERGSFGRYLRELPGPLVAMGRCLVALLVHGSHCCLLQKGIASWWCLDCSAAYYAGTYVLHASGRTSVVLPLGPSVSVGLLDVTYASFRVLWWPWADVLLHC